MGYEIQKLNDGVEGHPLELLYNLSDRLDEVVFNIERKNISSQDPHFHKKTTKIYIVMSGKGRLNIGEKEERIDDITSILIEPETIYAFNADSALDADQENKFDLLELSVPKYIEQDDFPVDNTGGD